jgi:hypothetical protein
MSLSITQTPATASLAQSPIIFTVAESNGALITSSSFQYVGELYYWQGTIYNSGSADYTITKYPNTATVGIFDLNRIINSTLTDLLQANPSNVMYFAVDFYTQYLNGTSYVTGSHVKSSMYKALDGYGIFPEAIGQQINSKTPHWPLMTDGPVTQSVFSTNYGEAGVYGGSGGGTVPTKVVYRNQSNATADFTLSPNTTSTGQIQQYPIGPSEAGFPLSTTGLTAYSVQAYDGATPLGTSIRYELDCVQKYPNIRIKWKNRYGQFDFFNFYMVNRQSFNTTKRTYQPQLGTWESATFGYNTYDSSNLNYIVDSSQAIQVNTFWVPETYNDIFKQLLVSDEIYWVTDEATDTSKPLTIATSNIVFKTGVVDKQIQYQFDFNIGQAYKLIM